MKCLKCGKKINEFDKYCEHCGFKQSKQMNIKEIIEKYKSKISKKIVKRIITFIIILLVFISAFKVISYLNSPIYVAKKYFKAIIDNDIESIYESFEIEEDIFVNQALLEEKIDGLDNVNYYNVKNVVVNDSSAFVEFEYTTKNNSNKKIAVVALEKNMNKKYFIFDDWYINSSKVSHNVKISVPTSSIVTIDSKDISDYIDKLESNEYYDVYIIDDIITGEYDINITFNNQEVNNTIDISNNTNYILTDFNLNDEAKKIIEDKGLSTLNTLYNSSIQNKKYSDIFSNNDFKNVYNNLKRNINNNSLTFSNLNVTEFEITNTSYYNGRFVVTGIADINYSYNYNDEVKNGTLSKKITLEFEYSDSYNLVNISNLNII